MKVKEAAGHISQRWMWPVFLFRDTHVKTVDACFEYCDTRGIPIVHKDDSAISPNTGTSAPNEIRLPTDWDDRSASSKATLFIEEIAHFIDHGGRLSWFVRYARPWWLVIYESRAKAARIRYGLFRSKSDGWARDQIDEIGPLLRKNYVTPRILRDRKVDDAIRLGLRMSLGV